MVFWRFVPAWLLSATAAVAFLACRPFVVDPGGDGDTDVDADADGDPGPGPGGDPGGDPVVEGSVGPGGACRCDVECQGLEGHAGLCVYGVCMTSPSAACSAAGSAAECPTGSRCWGLDGHDGGICWPDCASHDCAGECDGDGSCVFDAATSGGCDPTCTTLCEAADPGGDDPGGGDPIEPGDGSIGSPCSNDGDCDGATCYQDEDGGWVGGYCLGFGCSTEGASCGAGGICISGLTSDGALVCMEDCGGGCRAGYECLSVEEGAPGFCYPYCTSSASCPAGTACQDSVCVESCSSPADCGAGQECIDGRCVTDIGEGPGTGPVPACTALPPLECTGTAASCGELVQFSPTNAPDNRDLDGIPYDPSLGYVDYPENGETWANQYRSWLRRDAVTMIQYAAAFVACRAAGWEFGNDLGVGLIDMSERDGRIPGTSVGSPGHPTGTHTGGVDIDLAYYQVDTSDNAARPVCDHTEGGSEAYHCTGDPYLLDPWRTALFVGALAHHPHLRVIGMDGRVGPLVESALATLCRDGWLDGTACTRGVPLAYETTDTGRGWYLFHHHHMHVSFTP